MAWNLSGFTYILFSINHSVVFTSCSKGTWLVSSAKLWADGIKIQKEKSLKNSLNNVCTNINACGTPDKICLKLVVAFFFQDMSKYNAPNFYQNHMHQVELSEDHEECSQKL